ncbi:hypothetical protein HII31_11999 [Pseudocercospora fuligena]|uniref:F-box domain-containing protein n=1 Tax=Pseudocercospora fuligena TaxID=685502 RepID=A0A8H6RA85_9PEZI|nr:hypothetical protein HII31_11999 [Pseudocercospora fuligena]
MASTQSKAANATPIATPTTARSQVFGTTELLEEILLNLSFLDLFVIQRTSQNIRDTIHGSTKLKQRMFLESPPAEKLKDKILVNPLVERHNFSLSRTVSHAQLGPQYGSWYVEPYRLPATKRVIKRVAQTNNVQFVSPEALRNRIKNVEVIVNRNASEDSPISSEGSRPIIKHDNYSSWRRMHITLPPTAMFSTDLWWEPKWIGTRCGNAPPWLYRGTAYHRVHLNTPKLGDMIDVLDEDYKRPPPVV